MKYHSSFILFFHPKPYFPTYKKKINKKLKMQGKKKKKKSKVSTTRSSATFS